MSKLIGKDVNLGKTPVSKFKESKSITALQYFLEKKNNIKVRANSEDTIPNLDGSVMILDDNNTERITVDIQSKTLPENYHNQYPYKYDCDTKVFNVVLNNVTFNPVVLMLVDIESEKIYWKHISRDYAKSLQLNSNQKNKTIIFTENDLFDIDIFRNAMDQASAELETIIDTGINALITSNIENNNPFYYEMQKEIDRINNLFDNDLKMVKDFLFPNVWKFGIAYNKYSDNSSFLGIYKINNGKNGSLVKNFDFKNDEYMMSIYSGPKSKTTIRESLDSWISKVMNKYFNVSKLHTRYLSDTILNEIVFNFLDRLSFDLQHLSINGNRGVYFKDKEELNQVIKYILGLKSFYHEIFTSKNKKYPMAEAIKPYYNVTKKFLIFNPLIQPNEEEKTLLLKCIENPLPFPDSVFLSGSSDVEFELLEAAILELKQRKVNIVERVWKPQNWSEYIKQRKINDKLPCQQSKARGYLDEDLYDNLDILFKNFIPCLEYSYKNIPNGEKYRLKGKYYLLYDRKCPYEYKLFIKSCDEFEFVYQNKNLIEISEKLEKDTNYDYYISGSIDNIFALKLPLCTYITLMINKGVARSLGFNLTFDSEFLKVYTIKSIPIINDIK